MSYSREEIYERVAPFAKTCLYRITYGRLVKKGMRASSLEELDLIIKANLILRNKPSKSSSNVEENTLRRSKKELARRDAIKYTKQFKEWERVCKEHNKTSGILYLVKLYDEKESFLKIGITTTSLDRRFRDIPYKYKKIRVIEFDNIVELFIVETMIHHDYEKMRYYPNKQFSGYTECYKDKCRANLSKYLKKYIVNSRIENKLEQNNEE